MPVSLDGCEFRLSICVCVIRINGEKLFIIVIDNDDRNQTWGVINEKHGGNSKKYITIVNGHGDSFSSGSSGSGS